METRADPNEAKEEEVCEQKENFITQPPQPPSDTAYRCP